MNPAPSPDLACPLDGLALSRENNSWRCANGHSFDIARQGYVHLLPVQNKRSRDPGDSKEMVAARQAFLAAGYYQGVAAGVTDALKRWTESASSLRILDAGCGEGYYLRQLQQNGLTLFASGLDISKWAVIAASKQNPAHQSAQWLVGSNANLPLLPESQDVVLCMFGFPVYSEFSRVLKNNGLLIKVDAGPDHLLELRKIIYPTIKPFDAREQSKAEGFTALEHCAVRYTISLDTPEMIDRLLTMTPHLYRTTADAIAQARALDRIELTVDANINIFRKMP
jgi:23S rRNA (guanine745-N1)-methyltransferase